MEHKHGLSWVFGDLISTLLEHSRFFLPVSPKAGHLDPRLVGTEAERHTGRDGQVQGCWLPVYKLTKFGRQPHLPSNLCLLPLFPWPWGKLCLKEPAGQKPLGPFEKMRTFTLRQWQSCVGSSRLCCLELRGGASPAPVIRT